MSDDYDKDYSRRTKRRGGGPGGGPTDNYKQSRKPQGKDYNNYYDNRGYENKPKDQYNSNKGSYNSQYDDYDSRPPKNDNYSYKPKGPHQRRQNQDHGSNSWKKKAAKISKESILETFAKVKARAGIDEWVNNYRDLFVKEKQGMMNDEVFQLDPNNGLMPKVARTGGNGPENENDAPPEDNDNNRKKDNTASAGKGFEMFDFGKDRFDPIQALRGKTRPEDKGADKKKANEDTLENEEDIRGLESRKEQRGLEDRLEDKEDENDALGGDEEDFEGQYSNIDEMFARKMKNNEIPETFEDAFDDLLDVKEKKEKLKQLEDDERPVWEDVDTKEVIEDIKKEDFLASLPQFHQDKRAIFGDKDPRNEQNGGFTQSSRFAETNQNASQKPKDSELDLDNFDLNIRQSSDDFLLKQEDLFLSGLTNKNMPQRPSDNQAVNYQGMNPGMINPGNYPGHMMQQGNMARPPQQLLQMQYQQMHPTQQMPQMHQMMHPMHQPDHMSHLNQMNQMRGMGQMGSPDPYGNPAYMGNQLPAYKRNPGEQMNQNFQRPPTQAPNFIFKYFSPVYEEKVWHYIDTQNRLQGPFSGRTMDEWYLNGHLPLTLNVTIGKNNGFKTIKELSDIINAPNHAMQAHMRGAPQQEPQMPPMGNPQGNQGYSGISDLVRNRPELMQNSPTLPAQQNAMANKPAKTLDEVEQYGPGPGQQYNQYQAPQNMTKSNPGYANQRYPQQMTMGERANSEGPKNEMLSQLQLQNNPHVASAPSQNNPSGGNVLQGLASLGGGNQAVDMTAQLKNMLGLGLGNFGGPIVETAKPVESNVAQNPQNLMSKSQEKPQQQMQMQMQMQGQGQGQGQQQYQEKQMYQEKQPQRQERQDKQNNYNQYNYQEKQQQQQPQAQAQAQAQVQAQPQKKSTKAPKIDTSDFPSLTETYK